MRLSEAIRLNGMTLPQGFGADSVVNPNAPCAIGGALLAVGKDLTALDWMMYGENNVYSVFRLEWPWIASVRPVMCPACSEARGGVDYVIFHLNDGHRWTRNQIADWVASIEPLDIEVEAVDQDELLLCEKAR